MIRKRFPLRALISLLCGLYALGLAVYLISRVVIGDSRWWLAFLNNFTPYYFAPLLILFPLALLARAKRGALLMLPLVLIGALWFAPLFLPKNVALASDEALRVVTFNKFIGNDRLDLIETWLREQDADIVLMQEVSPRQVEPMLSALLDIYPYRIAVPMEANYWGNLILSKHPFVVPPDTPNYAQVNYNGQSIAVYAVHAPLPVGRPHLNIPTQNGMLSMLMAYDDSARNQQIAQLIDQLSREEYPYIVGGDFNMSEFSAPYHDLAALMGDSFREVGAGLGASWHAGGVGALPDWLPPLLRIDYVWHSDDFRATRVEQSPPLGSDHLGLSVTLQMQVE
jgi:vancomycin resistance protein VanJ